MLHNRVGPRPATTKRSPHSNEDPQPKLKTTEKVYTQQCCLGNGLIVNTMIGKFKGLISTKFEKSHLVVSLRYFLIRYLFLCILFSFLYDLDLSIFLRKDVYLYIC